MPELSAGAWLVDLRVLRAERGATCAVPCHHTVTSGIAEVPFTGPVEGRLVLTNLGSALRVEGTLATRVDLVCDLCAAPFRYRLAAVVEEELQWAGSDSHMIGTGEGVLLDLGSLAREALALALPIVARCRPDCQGLCARCGAELRTQRCACDLSRNENDTAAPPSIDPRLVPLASWRGNRQPPGSAG